MVVFPCTIRRDSRTLLFRMGCPCFPRMCKTGFSRSSEQCDDLAWVDGIYAWFVIDELQTTVHLFEYRSFYQQETQKNAGNWPRSRSSAPRLRRDFHVDWSD
jgi:hypothetical protein